ncbi:SpnB-like Rossmann fold domain-containing protein, partial [Micromonospora eburnea]
VHLRVHDNHTIELTITDPQDQLILTTDSLTLRPAGAVDDGDLYGVRWSPVIPPADPAPIGSVALLGEQPEVVLALEASGVEASEHPDLAALVAAIGAGLPQPSVVLAARSALPAMEPIRAAHVAVGEVLGLIQEWLSAECLDESRLVVVTCGAVAVDEGEHLQDLGSAPVWGLVRSAQRENPDRFALLDLDGQESSLRHLPEALTVVLAGEGQIAMRRGVFSALQVAKMGIDHALTPPEGEGAWRVDVSEPGTLDRLELV